MTPFHTPTASPRSWPLLAGMAKSAQSERRERKEKDLAVSGENHASIMIGLHSVPPGGYRAASSRRARRSRRRRQAREYEPALDRSWAPSPRRGSARSGGRGESGWWGTTRHTRRPAPSASPRPVPAA